MVTQRGRMMVPTMVPTKALRMARVEVMACPNCSGRRCTVVVMARVVEARARAAVVMASVELARCWAKRSARCWAKRSARCWAKRLA